MFNEANHVTNATRLAALAALSAVGGILEENKLILVKNTSLSDETTAAELEEADFTGYAPKTDVAFGPPMVVDFRSVATFAPSQTFVATGSAATSTVTGWALTNTAKTVVYAIGVLEDSKVFMQAGDGLVVQPVIAYPVQAS